jgi:FdhE protein
VASGFFRKLLGGRPVLPPHLAEAVAKVAKMAEQRPTLQGPCTLLAAILPDLFAEPAVESAPPFTLEKAREKMNAGVPLLRGEQVDFDRPSLHRRWDTICRHHGSDAARSLALAAKLDPAALLGDVLAGRTRPEAVTARAESLGLDPALTATTLRLAAYPALARIAAQLADVRQAVAWQEGFCPTCGSYPLLGEYRGLDQARVLRCGMCASGWEFPRLRCPFCGNSDHRTMGYFHVEGEENRFQTATCDQCRGYVKMASTLSALTQVQLLVTDLATLHLDLAAGDRGFLLR